MAYRKIEEYDQKTTQEIAAHIKAILELLGRTPRGKASIKPPSAWPKPCSSLPRAISRTVKPLSRALFSRSRTTTWSLSRTLSSSPCASTTCSPSSAKAHVAYIPKGEITGLSKVARVVETYARRLQVQERLTEQIRDCLQESLHPLGVAVVIEAMHTCMSMRGVQKSNAVTTTSAFSGIFLKSDKTRNEFLQLIGR